MNKLGIRQKILGISFYTAKNSVNKSIPMLMYETKKPENLEEHIKEMEENCLDTIGFIKFRK